MGVLAQIEPGHELATERAAAAFREEGVLRVQLHAGRVVGGMLAILADAHVAGGDAFHAAVLVIEDLGRREAGIDLHATSAGLLAQPEAPVAEPAGLVAFVADGRRAQEVRRLEPDGTAEAKEENPG